MKKKYVGELTNLGRESVPEVGCNTKDARSHHVADMSTL